MTPPPSVYFNLRSPYSWLAVEEIFARHPDAVNALRWLPYWDPDEKSLAELQELGGRFAYAQMSREKHFYILQDVKRLAASRGLSIRWPIDNNPCWEVPHLACLFAEPASEVPALALALSRARWVHGKNICDHDTVAEIASQVGLDGPSLASAEANPESRAVGAQTLRQAHRDGVFGVPFFVKERDRYWGVERLNDFMSAVSHGATGSSGELCQELDHAPARGPLESEAGHAGGCG